MNILMLLVVFALENVIVSHATPEKTHNNAPKRKLSGKVKRNSNEELPAAFQQNNRNCGSMNIKNTKHMIINGGVVQPSNKYPWMVSLVSTIKGKHCGGAIISDYYILTAAHCLFAENYGQVRHGAVSTTQGEIYSQKQDRGPYYRTSRFCKPLRNTDKEEIVYVKPENIAVSFLTSTEETRTRSGVSEVIPHEEYDGCAHDIGLLKMSEKINFDEFASPICLPNQGIDITSGLTISGWGQSDSRGSASSSNPLREGYLESMPFEECKRRNPSFGRLDKTYTCVKGSKGTTSCFGDSGGSMFKIQQDKAYAIGITSMYTGRGKCEISDPIVYTSVLAHNSWLQENMK